MFCFMLFAPACSCSLPLQSLFSDEVLTNINFSDISYTMYQYRTFGYVTKSMLIVDALQTFYVVDFFFHESW